MKAYTFEELWDSEDIQKIMSTASKKYRTKIDTDEITQIKRIAVWKGMEVIKKRNDISIQTAIYNNVVWGCNHILKNKIRDHKRFKKRVDINTIERPKRFKTDYVEDTLFTDYESDLLHDIYVKQMTLQEIGNEKGYSKETIRKRKNSKIERIRDDERNNSHR